MVLSQDHQITDEQNFILERMDAQAGDVNSDFLTGLFYSVVSDRLHKFSDPVVRCL